MKVYTVSYSQRRRNVEGRDQHHAQVAFPLWKERLYPLNRRLCESQRCSGRFEEEKFLLTLPAFEPVTVTP